MRRDLRVLLPGGSVGEGDVWARVGTAGLGNRGGSWELSTHNNFHRGGVPGAQRVRTGEVEERRGQKHSFIGLLRAVPPTDGPRAERCGAARVVNKHVYEFFFRKIAKLSA